MYNVVLQGKPHIFIGGPGTPQTPQSARIQPGLTIPRTPTTPTIAGNTGQKFVIMQQQRLSTPSQSPGTSIVKVLPGQQTMASSSNPGQKIMVMSLPQTMSGSHAVQQVQVASGEPTMRTVFTTGDQQTQQVTIMKTESNT